MERWKREACTLTNFFKRCVMLASLIGFSVYGQQPSGVPPPYFEAEEFCTIEDSIDLNNNSLNASLSNYPQSLCRGTGSGWTGGTRQTAYY